MQKLLYTRQEPVPFDIVEQFKIKQIEVISIPLIRTLPLNYAVPHKGFDWYFFTSAKAVKYFDCSKLSAAAKVLAIGNKTAEALGKKGVTVDFIPEGSYSESLIRQWLLAVAAPQKICLPVSQQARHIIKEELEKAGHEVTEICIYQTIFPEEQKAALTDLLARERLDYAIFASPSAWHHFYRRVQLVNVSENFWRSLHIITIGPVTTGVVQKDRQSVWLEAEVQDMDYLFQKILQKI